VIVNSSANIN